MVTVFSTTQGHGQGSEAVLCEMLRAWPTDGLRLRIAAPRGSRVITCASDFDFTVLPLDSGRDAILNNAHAMYQTFCATDILSLAHAWSARGFEFAWWLKRRFGVPASGTLHDHPNACFHGRCRQRIMQFSMNRLDGLVAVSGAVADAVPECRTAGQVIRNGLCDVATEKQPHDDIRIGFLGMHAMSKGIALVADWVDQCRQNDNVQWHLYGTPLQTPSACIDYFRSCPSARVVMRGKVNPESIFSEIDILVHASTEFDSLPTVLIEAARAGIPCVASSLGGAPEIVDHGRTGYLFDPADPQSGLVALQRLVMDVSLRSVMGQAARQRYERDFKAGRMAAAYQGFWQRLLVDNRKKG